MTYGKSFVWRGAKVDLWDTSKGGWDKTVRCPCRHLQMTQEVAGWWAVPGLMLLCGFQCPGDARLTSVWCGARLFKRVMGTGVMIRR